MLDKLKDLWSRLKVRWHVLVLACAAAAPEILNYLGLIDLRPILSQFLNEGTVNLIVSILPFALVFVKSAFSITPKEGEG